MSVASKVGQVIFSQKSGVYMPAITGGISMTC